MLARYPILAGAALLLSARLAGAQQLDGLDWTNPTRFDLSAGVIAAQPVGDFGRHVDAGVGFDLTGAFRLDREGRLAIRADLGLLDYGSETRRERLLPNSGRIDVEIETTNSIFLLGIGPEIRRTSGRVRPFANAGIEVASFSTKSWVRGTDDSESFASTTNHEDDTPAWRAGGGLYVPFGSRHWTGGFTVAATYHGGGKASYLREGSITDDGNGGISYTPIRSRTEFWTYQVGFRMAVPRNFWDSLDD